MRTRDEIESDELGWEAVLEVLLDIRDLLTIRDGRHRERLEDQGDWRYQSSRKGLAILKLFSDSQELSVKEIHAALSDGTTLAATHQAIKRLWARGELDKTGTTKGGMHFRRSDTVKETS
jgi:hypothetical protein